MALIKSKLDPQGIREESERTIYKLLSNMDEMKTKDWVIYYSLHIKRRDHFKIKDDYFDNDYKILKNSEIDFLILAPNLGIFVFEIKGGKIEVKDGQIYQYNRKEQEFHKCDVYGQANRNFYTLKDYILNISSSKIDINKFVSGTLVGFPDMETKIVFGTESNKHDAYFKNGDIYGFIIDNAKYLYEHQDPYDRNKMIPPTKEDIDKIVHIIDGPDFIYGEKLSNYIDSIGLQLKDLTDDQKVVFNGIKDNKRCLITGKAGTGKTVLCEFLYNEKSSLLGKEKESVIYFTFNRLISERLQNDLQHNDSSLCIPILDYIEKEYTRITKCNVTENNYDKKKEFLFREIGKIARERKSELRKYECLIIDEAQDLEDNTDLFCFLDAILNNGIDDGECYIFYDNQQNIFNKQNVKLLYMREEFELYRYTKLTLFKNCRNSKNIKDIIDQFSSKRVHDISDLDIPNDKYSKIFNTSLDDCANIIYQEIMNLNKNEGIKFNQITLLFERKIDNNRIFLELKKLFNNRISTYNINSFQNITCATVTSFKGLENDIIFYINDNPYSGHATHYVALSRAKIIAYLFKVNTDN